MSMMKFAIGQSVPRTEDPRLLRGRGQYVDDFALPRQAHAVMVRSPYPHADIKSIDASAALAFPGVIDVLTGADYAADGLGNIMGPTPYKRRDGAPMFRPPRPAITNDRVRHVGQIVAIVIAESVNAAKDAADLVEVDYDPLPIVLGTAEAAEDGQVQIWDDCPNNESFLFESGDRAATDAAIASAPRVITNTFVINRIHANTMEPRGALADYDPGRDHYTIYSGLQRAFAGRATLCKNIFKIRQNQMRFVTGDMGGSFGMKGAMYPEIPLAAWASKRVGRPVKWRCDRSEGFMADDHCRDNVSTVDLALDDDGKFLGLRVRTSANLGAYLSSGGFGPPTNNLGGLAGVYTTPAIHVEVAAVFTNTSPTSAYRGAGRPEASYILERSIDMAAREMGIDPAELRRRNMIAPEAMPYKTPLTFTYDCGEFETVLDHTLEKAGYAGFADRRAQSEAAGKLRGIGMSYTIERAASPSSETAELRFDTSGTATVLVGTTQHGQGHETVYKQILCEKLGLEPEDIAVIEGDTDKVSYGTGTGGSRSAAIGGTAVLQAADKVIDKTRKIAAHLLEASEQDITLEDGKFVIAGTDRAIPFQDAAVAAFDPKTIPEGMEQGLYEFATYAPDVNNYPNGCHVCEVEISKETGEIDVLQYTVIDDCGVELNPLLVKGQVHGGIAQGAGQALMENIVYEETGQLVSGSFMDYTMPRADNFCSFDISAHPVPTKTNPLGVKGVGEAGTVGSLAAMMNAVNNALESIGAAHLEMPLTPPRVWRAVQEASIQAVE
jgi:carbon-monoxide dehydrogenase large subunit